MELMLHRRLLVDDHWGVGEALNEMAYGKGLVARGKHYLLFDFDKEEANRRTRLLANELYGQHLITFDDHTKKLKTLSTTTISLPTNVNLLTLEKISQNKDPFVENLYLVRFEHLFDIDEHPVLSLPVKIPFKAFIEGYFNAEIKTVQETTLGGNRFKDDALEQRFQWNVKETSSPTSIHKSKHAVFEPNADDFDEIELKPMEIRSFQVELL